jgi:hypothetical protein
MSESIEATARLEALERRLAEVEAVQAIQNLKSEYGTLADARYTRSGVKDQPEVDRIADRIAALFSEDGVWDGGAALGRCEGRDAIRERFREPTLLFSWHFFVKPEIRVSGRTAMGTWDVLALCTSPDGRALWMVGAEHDEYACVDGVWLHTRMRLEPTLMAPHETGWAPRPT